MFVTGKPVVSVDGYLINKSDNVYVLVGTTRDNNHPRVENGQTFKTTVVARSNGYYESRNTVYKVNLI